MFIKFLFLVVGIPVGFWLVRYRARIVDSIGKMSWAERYLGDGGTYNVWILIGTAVVAGSILYFFDLLPGV